MCDENPEEEKDQESATHGSQQCHPKVAKATALTSVVPETVEEDRPPGFVADDGWDN